MSDIQITPSFATPFITRNLDDCESLNRELKALFIAREAEGDKYAEEVPTLTLKVKLFESEFGLFNWPESSVQKLKHFCFDTLGKVVNQVNGTPPEDLQHLRIFNHAWFHITRPGGYMGSHNHPMASWSGVYCVDAGEPDPDNTDSGMLRFHDPRPSTTMFMDAANNHLRPPFQPGLRFYPMRAGQLVIFPSFLMHEVAPFTGSGTRITVAFNAWMRDGRVAGNESAQR